MEYQTGTDISSMFSKCKLLKTIPNISKWKINNIKSLYCCFFECESIREFPDLSLWKTDNIIDISFLFSKCKSIKSLPDISKWNIDKVKKLSGIFSECSLLESLPDISKWFNKPFQIKDYSIDLNKIKYKIQDKYYKFELDDLKGINLSYMFYNCESLKALPDISLWNIDNAISLKGIFCNCTAIESLPDISK